MRVQSLGWEDPLEDGMTTHSSILPWRIPWTEEPVGYSPWGRKRVRYNLANKQQLFTEMGRDCGRSSLVQGAGVGRGHTGQGFD